MNPSQIQTELSVILPPLLFYDYFLTFEWEVSRYWARPNLSWATILFFLNRYGTLLGNIPVVLQYFWTTPSTPEKTRMYGLCNFVAEAKGRLIRDLSVDAYFCRPTTPTSFS
ncbi:hypothetical protein C8J57DRAFT_1372487 [Mycena rebaudengoi]|nr:hypothetical protein C8J57DRAFT_1372487 [Mycena rebaudengoi]